MSWVECAQRDSGQILWYTAPIKLQEKYIIYRNNYGLLFMFCLGAPDFANDLDTDS